MNAKEELLNHIADRPVKCAIIDHAGSFGDARTHKAILRVGHSPEEFKLFLGQIDFEYNAGYGSQELTGNIWYKDGTWSERGEYDGSEWWEYKETPELPEEVLPLGCQASS